MGLVECVRNFYFTDTHHFKRIAFWEFPCALVINKPWHSGNVAIIALIFRFTSRVLTVKKAARWWV